MSAIGSEEFGSATLARLLAAGDPRHGLADRLVVGLGAAVERGEQVRRAAADVQLVDVPPVRRADQGDQGVVLQADLLAGVEVEVADLERRRAGRIRPSASSRALSAAIRLR